MNWTKTSEKLPCELGQVKVLFCGYGWATFIVGLFTCFENGENEWYIYDQEKDKYYQWEFDIPELWMLAPDVPDRN